MLPKLEAPRPMARRPHHYRPRGYIPPALNMFALPERIKHYDRNIQEADRDQDHRACSAFSSQPWIKRSPAGNHLFLIRHPFSAIHSRCYNTDITRSVRGGGRQNASAIPILAVCRKTRRRRKSLLHTAVLPKGIQYRNETRHCQSPLWHSPRPGIQSHVHSKRLTDLIYSQNSTRGKNGTY